MNYRFLFLCVSLCSPILSQAVPPLKAAAGKKDAMADVRIASDSMTVMYGNSLIERLQEDGTFEALMHASQPNKKQQFRSMAYTGDQVHYRIRASRFGAHLSYLVKQWPADRVFMGFGMYESFAGQAGLEKFKKDLKSYVQLIKFRHPNGNYVLISPIAVEDGHDQYQANRAQRNSDLALYTKAMQEIATSEKIGFVNLFDTSTALYKSNKESLTDDGTQLNSLGNALIAQALASELSGRDKVSAIKADSDGFIGLKKLVQRKAQEVAQCYHPANGISYYGVRARSYEYKPEIPHLLKIANQLDQNIWQQSGKLNSALNFPKLPVLHAQMPSKPPKAGLGIIKTSAEDLKDFTVADGFEVKCFASSEDFPELINPLQIRFDAKGRLWVTCFASYPHPLPGDVANDKILIFEDTDGDGKADKKTVFAEGLMLPDGFVFYKEGIIASVSRKLIYLADTDGDDKADVRTELLRGIDDTDTHHSGYLSRTPQGDVMVSEALFHRGQLETPQGVVHTKDVSIMRFNPENKQLTVERQTQAPNPWKISFDRWGESIQFYGGGQIIDADLHNIWTPMGHLAPTALGMPFRYDKGSTCEIVESSYFPKDWQGGLLTGHLLRTNEINFTPLTLVKGAKKSAGKKTVLIKSKNKIFRPTDITFGLDGALYISDFYYPIIGHAQHSIRDKNRDYANGRIWKITRKGHDLLNVPTIVDQPIAKLITLLEHPHLRVRELVRVELEKQPRAEVIQAIKQLGPRLSKSEPLALEVLWLTQRLGYFQDTSIINALIGSNNIQFQRAAARALRFWAPALGINETKEIIKSLSTSRDERLRIALVSVISHLQRTDKSWTKLLNGIQAEANSPLSLVKKMAGWNNKQGLAPEIPLLSVSPETALKKWSGSNLKNEGVIYLRCDKECEVVIGHRGTPNINIDVNDVPLLVASGSNLTHESQNNVSLKKGINKVRYFFNNKKGKVNIYLADKFGSKPSSVVYLSGNQVAQAKAEFNKVQSLQWKAFARNTFAQNCANCHSIDGNKAVGPPLNGLFGKTQVIVDSKGKESTVKIDEAYLRQSIVDPASMMPKGYQPLMPKMPLNEKEIDNLVRWMKQLK